MRHPWSDRGVVAAFVAVALGAAIARPLSVAVVLAALLVGVVALAWGVRRPEARVLAVVAAAAIAGSWAADELHALHTSPRGPWQGVATLRTDPDRVGAGVRAIIDVAGRRHEVWAWGAQARSLERRLAGEQVVVVGRRQPLDGRRQASLLARHVAGRFDLDMMAGAGAGSAATRAANRVHRAVGTATTSWPTDRRALLSGLVLGNDAALSQSAVDAFRTSGLAHLTAVSGQNVALLLAMAAPALSRVRRGWRWALTLAVIAWFATLTRYEPSVLRASAMALLGATATVLGRDRRPTRLLALAGIVLVLVDPLLVRSVSFWLSMSATTGLLLATPSLLRVLERRSTPRPAGAVVRATTTALAATAGAQTGVLLVSTAVFGLPSSIGLLTNLLAVPPAGLVMMSGPPLAALGAMAPQWAPWATLPIQALVWWIDAVAHVGQRLAPPTAVDLAVWAGVVAVTARGAWRRRHGR